MIAPSHRQTRYEIKLQRSGLLWETRNRDGAPLLFKSELRAAEITADQIVQRDGGLMVSLDRHAEGVWALILAFPEPVPTAGDVQSPTPEIRAGEDRPALADLSRSNPFCETCRWWKRWTVQSNPGGTFGECRRNSPIIALVRNAAHEDRHLSKWPNVRAEDWCGRHASVPGGLAPEADRES